MTNSVQFIGSGKPFGSTAKLYRTRGWLGVMPLAAKTKHPPPAGYTGRGGKFADDETVNSWIENSNNAKGNIAIHLGFPVVVDDVEYEIIGLDVDHRPNDPDDPKFGYDQLKVLEKKYGKLPDTYTSNSRNDGYSGIRFYLVPTGYSFRGNCGEHGSHIDIIQRVHRYAVVYPSFHPKGGQYLWFPPGVETKGIYEQEIPWTSQLPRLPEKWLEFLTRGGLKDSEGYGIDLDTSTTDIFAWADANFPPNLEDVPGGMCEAMRKKVAFWKDKIENSSESHYQLVGAHWNTILWGAEGHHGWRSAVRIIERTYIKDTLNRNKRELAEVKAEVFRSRVNALRKIKAKVDSYAEQGLNYLGSCSCKKPKGPFSAPKFTVVKGSGQSKADAKGAQAGSQAAEISDWVAKVPVNAIGDKKYPRNDDGNAEAMYDLYSGNLHWISDWGKWLIWNGKQWHFDDFNLIKALFREGVVNTYFDAHLKKLKYEAAKYRTSPGANDQKADQMDKDVADFAKWMLQCGNMTRSEAAVRALRSFPLVSKKFEELNADPLKLQTAGDTVVKLTRRNRTVSTSGERIKGFSTEASNKQNYITFSTGGSYKRYKDQDREAVALFNGYLNTFLPDRDYRRFVRKALGHAIIGGNPERLAIFLQGATSTGKSTILTAIQAALGTYASTFNPNNVFKEKQSGLNPELASHLHRRVICASEAGSQQIHANIFKRITGKEHVTAERKGSNEIIVAIPQFVPLVATNSAPTINGEDEALRKRILVLPFDVQVSEAADDKGMDVELAEKCKDIILFWLLQGYTDYVNEGLDYSTWHPWAKERTLDFNSELSSIGEFLEEMCELVDRETREKWMTSFGPVVPKDWCKVSVASLYSAYVQYCEVYHMKPFAMKRFSREVANQGYQKKKERIDGKSITVWVGIKLKNDKTVGV